MGKCGVERNETQSVSYELFGEDRCVGVKLDKLDSHGGDLGDHHASGKKNTID